VMSYDGDEHELGATEQFFRALAKIPRVEKRLDACLFKFQFTQIMEETEEQVGVYDVASQALMDSKNLKKIMALILRMGNYLNAADKSKGGAYGFSLSTLSKLKGTKGGEGKTDLMRFLVEQVTNKDPSCRQFVDDLKDVKAAARIESAFLAGSVQKVEGSINRVKSELAAFADADAARDRFKAVMTPFFNTASGRFVSVNGRWSGVKERCSKLVTYYGEKGDVKPEELFSTFSMFVETWVKTETEIKQGEEAAAKQAKADQARAQMKAAAHKGEEKHEDEQTKTREARTGTKFQIKQGQGGVVDQVMGALRPDNADAIAAAIRARRAR